MKILIFCTSFLTVQASIFLPRVKFPPLNVSERAAFPAQELLMKINQFDENDENVFNMRYASSDVYFNKTGPMFINIGGENILEDDLSSLQDGLMHDMAKELGGYMFATEHRYYGLSVPNMNLETKNLKYLTIDQALADLAEFIKNRKEAIPELQNSKVIVVGGSYSGSLAAWMRLKYPDIVDAAVSSSGVFNLKVDNFEYFEIVLRKLSNQKRCLNIYTNAFKTLRKKLFLNSRSAIEAQKDFGLCPLFNPHDNQEKLHLLIKIQTFLSGIVQYENPNMNDTIEDVCNALILKSDEFHNDYYSLATVYKLRTFNEYLPCSTSYATDINNMYRNTAVSNSIGRQWTYQECTEIGFITNRVLFSNTSSLQYWYKFCYDLFKLTPDVINNGIANTRRKYGGLNPKVTNVVFTVGTDDPWSGIGMTHSPNENAPFIAIKGASHCNDISPDYQSEEIEVARKFIKEHIYSWVK